MTRSPRIVEGQRVRAVGLEPSSPTNGQTGTVLRVRRANSDYERRAEVKLDSGRVQTIALRFLAPA